MSLKHGPHSTNSLWRNVTLQYIDGNNRLEKLTLSWLTLSATESVIDFEIKNDGWIFQLFKSQLLRRVDAVVFEFIVENGGITKGIFELDDSDMDLIPFNSCG